MNLDFSQSLAPIYTLANLIAERARRDRARQEEVDREARAAEIRAREAREGRQFSTAERQAAEQAADRRAREAREFSVQERKAGEATTDRRTEEARQYTDRLRREQLTDQEVRDIETRNQGVDAARTALWTISGYIDTTDTLPAEGTLDDDKKARAMASRKLAGLLKAQKSETERIEGLLRKTNPQLVPNIRGALVDDPNLFEVWDGNKKLQEAFRAGSVSIPEVMEKLPAKQRTAFAQAYTAKLEAVKGSIESAELRQAITAARENTSRYSDLNVGLQSYLQALQRVSPGSIPEAFQEVYSRAPEAAERPSADDPVDAFLKTQGLGGPAPATTPKPAAPQVTTPATTQPPSPLIPGRFDTQSGLFPEGSTGILPFLDRATPALGNLGIDAINRGAEFISALPDVLPNYQDVGRLLYSPPPYVPSTNPPPPVPGVPLTAAGTQFPATSGVFPDAMPVPAIPTPEPEYFPYIYGDQIRRGLERVAAPVRSGLEAVAAPVRGALETVTAPLRGEPSPASGAPNELLKQRVIQDVFGTSDMGTLGAAKAWYIRNSGLTPEQAQADIDQTIVRAMAGDVQARAKIRRVMTQAFQDQAPALMGPTPPLLPPAPRPNPAIPQLQPR